MFLNNVKITTVALLLAAALDVGAGGLFSRAQADPPGSRPPSQPSIVTSAPVVNDQAAQVKSDAMNRDQDAQPHAIAAHNAYQIAVRLVQARSPGAKLDDVYTWSVRWLNAQRDVSANKEDRLSALSEHLKRMQELAQVAAAITKVGQGSPLDSVAADYYLREAEFWLAQAKAGAKQTDK